MSNTEQLVQVNSAIISQRELTIELDKQANQIKKRLIELQQQEADLLGPDYSPGCQLVDGQGYPIPVDLYAVRQCRNEAIRLVNDHKALLGRIETEMLKTFQLIGQRDELGGGEDEGEEDSQTTNDQNIKNGDSVHDQASEIPYSSPFLRIGIVMEDTPAAEAGLCDGDQIVLFGDINAEAFEEGGLQQLINLVQENENRPLKIVYLHHETFTITITELTPRTWQGQGLLGCKVVPI